MWSVICGLGNYVENYVENYARQFQNVVCSALKLDVLGTVSVKRKVMLT